MGKIQEAGGAGRSCILEPDHTVGRTPPPSSALHIDKTYVSGIHATLRWVGKGWIVRDLGSRNGTYVDGARIASGEERELRQGSRIGFGKVEEEWTLVDDAAPVVMAVPVAGGEVAVVDGEMLALPSQDDPRATIYRNDDGGWTLEHANEPARALVNRDTFDVDGTLWRFCCQDTLAATMVPSGLAGGLLVRNLRLEFAVSSDEEFVQLHAVFDGKRHDLGSRAHNYLLLTLARRRLADEAAGLSESSCGWIEQESLAHDPSMAPPRLHIDVFRIRTQFAKVGVVDPAQIVERRERPGQIRIGCKLLTVTPI
jgi:hypothetical protein